MSQMMTSYSGVALRLTDLDLRGCRRMGRAAGKHYHDAIDRMHGSVTSFNGLDLPQLATITQKVRERLQAARSGTCGKQRR